MIKSDERHNIFTMRNTVRWLYLLPPKLLLLSAIFLPLFVSGFGNERASFHLSFDPNWENRYFYEPPLNGTSLADSDPPTDAVRRPRQNVCARYDQVRFGELELGLALAGLELRPIIMPGHYFNYDEETGIQDGTPDGPGIMADIMDELARRGEFKWRNSFAVTEEAPAFNTTFTELLRWSVEAYDISVNWWDKSMERMEAGVAFLEPWLDGSLILIDKENPPEKSNEINLLNWTKPFETDVWLLILFTVVASGLGYQVIEHLGDEQDGRSFGQWFADNLYLSSLNFTQNYEYAPNSPAGRIFGVSMGIWSLVITATYTANLASLFVEVKGPPLRLDSLEHAVQLEYKICTYESTNAEFIVENQQPSAKLVSRPDELSQYQSLHAGRCDVAAAYKANWLEYQRRTEYNPDCDLEWVGRTVEDIKSGFAVKADVGHLCTGLIRDVLDLHMVEMIREGVLDELWDNHYRKKDDKHCEIEETEEEVGGARFRKRRQRRLGEGRSSDFFGKATPRVSQQRHRRLKAAGRSSNSSEEGTSLTLEQMLGTFVLHWFMTIAAILLAAGSKLYKSRLKDIADKQIELRFRPHGPIIGSPPRMNTFVYRGPSTVLGEENDEASQIQESAKTAQDEDKMSSSSSSTSSEDYNNHTRGYDGRRVRSSGDDATKQKWYKELISNQKSVRETQEEMREPILALQQQQQELSRQMALVVKMLQGGHYGGIPDLDNRALDTEETEVSF